MPREDHLDMEGVVVDALGGGQYRVDVDNGPEAEPTSVRARLSGHLRNRHIRVIPGDNVTVSVSPYDLTHGIITYRGSKKVRRH